MIQFKCSKWSSAHHQSALQLLHGLIELPQLPHCLGKEVILGFWKTFVRNELQPELVLEIKTKLWDFDFNSVTVTLTKTISSNLFGERSEFLSRLGQSLLIDLRTFEDIPLFFDENLRWPLRLQSAVGWEPCQCWSSRSTSGPCCSSSRSSWTRF